METRDILYKIREALINGNFMERDDEVIEDCKWKSMSHIIKDALGEKSDE